MNLSDSKPNLRRQDAINEVRVLSSLKHPYIVSEPESKHLLNIVVIVVLRLMVSCLNPFSQNKTFSALFDLGLRHLVSSNRSGLTEKVTRRIGTWPLPLGMRLDSLIEDIMPQHQTGFIECGICMNLFPTRKAFELLECQDILRCSLIEREQTWCTPNPRHPKR